MSELYKGEEVFIDYKETNDKDLIEFFEEASNLEGYATIEYYSYDNEWAIIEDYEYIIDTKYIIRKDI